MTADYDNVNKVKNPVPAPERELEALAALETAFDRRMQEHNHACKRMRG